MTIVYFVDRRSRRRRRHYPLVVAEAAADGLGLGPATLQLLLNDELLENGKNAPVGRVLLLLQLMDGLLVLVLLAESTFAGPDADVLVTGVFVVALSSCSSAVAGRLGLAFTPARLFPTGRRTLTLFVLMDAAEVDKCCCTGATSGGRRRSGRRAGTARSTAAAAAGLDGRCGRCRRRRRPDSFSRRRRLRRGRYLFLTAVDKIVVGDEHRVGGGRVETVFDGD